MQQKRKINNRSESYFVYFKKGRKYNGRKKYRVKYFARLMFVQMYKPTKYLYQKYN